MDKKADLMPAYIVPWPWNLYARSEGLFLIGDRAIGEEINRVGGKTSTSCGKF